MNSKNKSIFIVFALVLLNIKYCFSENAKTIAVIDFESENVRNSVEISDFLRGELAKKDYIKVMSKADMVKIFGEKNNAYQSCQDQKCAVEIGKMLNMQSVVIGVHSKHEKGGGIALKVVDVETGSIIVDREIKFDNAGMMNRAVRQLANLISTGVEKEEKKKIEKEQNKIANTAPSARRRNVISVYWGYIDDYKGGTYSELSNAVIQINGAGIFYNYQQKPYLHYKLGLGFYKLTLENTKINFFYPGTVSYCFFPGKKISPFLGMGLHYWKKQDNSGKGINVLVAGGLNIPILEHSELNLEIGYFNTNSSANVNALAFNSGITWMFQ